MTNRSMSRLIAIGDVHGCDRALAALLEWIQPTADDTIVQLGDLIDRGPNACEVIDLMITSSAQCHVVQILGNHEELMFDALVDAANLPGWLRNGGDMTLRSYGWSRADSLDSLPKLLEHVEYLKSAVSYYETEDHVFIHAGFFHDQPWDRQSNLVLRWRATMRGITQPHMSGKTVICGHTAQKSGEILELDRVRCIDTNCFRGGWLTAVDVTTNQIWQIDRLGRIR